MAEYTRDYPMAPTAEEVKIGYAPSTIRGGPFAKFLFWTFAGLGVTFLITWGAIVGIDAVVQSHDQAVYQRAMRKRPIPVEGPRLQPSVEHETLDYEDTENMHAHYYKQQSASGWEPDPKRPGQLVVGEDVTRRAKAAMDKQANAKPGEGH